MEIKKLHIKEIKRYSRIIPKNLIDRLLVRNVPGFLPPEASLKYSQVRTDHILSHFSPIHSPISSVFEASISIIMPSKCSLVSWSLLASDLRITVLFRRSLLSINDKEYKLWNPYL